MDRSLKMSISVCDCCGGFSCKTDEYLTRALYHAGRLQGSCHKDVLERYERHRQEKDVLQLQKYTFHVASWITQLPHAEMSQRYGELSGVILLANYLKSLKQASVPLCQQLIKVLQDVFVISETEQWMRLSRILVLLLPQLGKPLVDMEPPGTCRLLTRDIQVWRNATTNDSQECYVSELEKALEQSDRSQLHRIFRAAVAALSPPRLGGINARGGNESLMDAETTSDCQHRLQVVLDPEDGHEMEDQMEGVEPERRRSDFQRRLRKVVLGCLDKLDLTDPKVKPALQLLELRIQRFQELVGQDQIASRRDWAQLETKCGMAKTLHVNGVKRERKRKHCEHSVRQDICKHEKLKQDCSECAPCKHGLKQDCSECIAETLNTKAEEKLKRRSIALAKEAEKLKCCRHGVRPENCKHCSKCSCGRYNCLQCSACPHGKRKDTCSKCKGCQHGKLKRDCLECNPCPHGRVKKNCKECSGCPHGKWKHDCRECNGCQVKLKKRRQSFDENGITSSGDLNGFGADVEDTLGPKATKTVIQSSNMQKRHQKRVACHPEGR